MWGNNSLYDFQSRLIKFCLLGLNENLSPLSTYICLTLGKQTDLFSFFPSVTMWLYKQILAIRQDIKYSDVQSSKWCSMRFKIGWINSSRLVCGDKWTCNFHKKSQTHREKVAWVTGESLRELDAKKKEYNDFFFKITFVILLTILWILKMKFKKLFWVFVSVQWNNSGRMCLETTMYKTARLLVFRFYDYSWRISEDVGCSMFRFFILVLTKHASKTLDRCLKTVYRRWETSDKKRMSNNRVPTFPGKPGKPWKMSVHLENLEISWNFAKNNKNHGKITWNLEKILLKIKKWFITVIIISIIWFC